MDENNLIEKCIAHDHKAWDEFTRRHYSVVLKCVRHKLRLMGEGLSRNYADDIAQEIFVMLWRTNRLANVRNSASIKGWLAIVSINFTASIVHTKNFKKDQKTLSLDAFLHNDEDFSLMSGLSNNGFSKNITFDARQKETPLEYRELQAIVKKEISKLVPKQALALKLNLLDNIAQKDIAKLLKIPENTVATIIRRGKSRLSKRLKTLLKLNF